MIRRVVLFSLFCGALLVIAAAPKCSGQARLAAEKMGEVVLTKLGPITYPQVARTAHIAGDVEVSLEIKQDGTVASADAVSGPALLERVAVQTAQQSQFECRNCGDGVLSAHLLFTFKLLDNPDNDGCGGTPVPTGCPANQVFPAVTVSGEHVTVVGVAPYRDAYTAVLRTTRRAWKCLYLWHCGR